MNDLIYSQNLRSLRELCGLSPEMVAQILHVTKHEIDRLETAQPIDEHIVEHFYEEIFGLSRGIFQTYSLEKELTDEDFIPSLTLDDIARIHLSAKIYMMNFRNLKQILDKIYGGMF